MRKERSTAKKTFGEEMEEIASAHAQRVDGGDAGAKPLNTLYYGDNLEILRLAIARIAAEGPVAFAQHANDPVARQILADPHAEQTQMLILSMITLLSLVPIAYYARAVRQRLGGRTRSNQSGSG